MIYYYKEVIKLKLLINVLIISSSILNTLLASNFKRRNYIYGLICYLLMGIVALKNQIYGMFFFYVFIFAPLQIYGFINWGKNKKQDQDIVIRSFSFKNRIILIFSCIITSLSLAFILEKIPGAKFTYLDAFSNIINLCGVILLALKFNESWWLWLINNIIDVILWSSIHHLSGDYSLSMLLASIVYLIINFYGIFKWNAKSIIFDIIKIQEKKQIILIAYMANIISSLCYLIVFNWIGFFVSIFDIIISLIDSFKIKNKKYICILGFILLSILIFSPIKKTWISILPLLDLFLYSFIPILKRNIFIRIIGLINITLFTIFDSYIGLYNLLFLDILILVLFIYQIFINKNENTTNGKKLHILF